MQEMHAALHNAGYRSSQAHHEPTALKTDAPASILWDIMRSYCKLHPPLGSKHREHRKQRLAAKRNKAGASGPVLAEQDAGDTILAKEPSFLADFTITSEIKVKFIDREVARFPSNPGSHFVML
jgi:tRNA (guanine26-N2/guanine27-N2)-dimethyltransferase